jgi:hypothetical protein
VTLFGSNCKVTWRWPIKPKIKEPLARWSLLCQTNARGRGWCFSVQIAKSHEGDPSNQKSKNCQLAGAYSAKLTLEGEGDAFGSNCKVAWRHPSNQKRKNHQLSKAGAAKLTLEGDGDVFFSTAIGQILVPYRQVGQCSIHLTSNSGMTSVPQKEMLHRNGLHCHATSLRWWFFQHKSQCKRSFQPKTKSHQITEASSAYLMLEGEGGAFWFQQTWILYSKLCEGDLVN